jgi:hypothetical protein
MTVNRDSEHPGAPSPSAQPSAFANIVAVTAHRLRELAAEVSASFAESELPFSSDIVAENARTELAACAAAEPVVAGAALQELMVLPPGIARGAIDGLLDAARLGRPVPWDEVAEYAEAVVHTGPETRWSEVMYRGDASKVAADQVELLRTLTAALADAVRCPSEPQGLAGCAASESLPTIVSALERLLTMADPDLRRPDSTTGQSDVPARGTATLATDALIRLLPHESDDAALGLRRLLSAANGSPAVQAALGYRLADIAMRQSAWVRDHIDDILGPVPASGPQGWTPALRAHLAGPPLPNAALHAVLPWYRAAANHLGPNDTYGPASTATALLSHLVRAMLRGELAADDVTLAALLSRGGGVPAAFVGEIIEELLIDRVPTETADRARAGVIAACTAARADNSTAEALAQVLGLLADPFPAASLGELWVLDRLRWALDRHVAPLGAWYVARLVATYAASGHPGAGEMCADLAWLLAAHERDSTAELLASAATTRGDEAWAREVLDVLSWRQDLS